MTNSSTYQGDSFDTKASELLDRMTREAAPLDARLHLIDAMISHRMGFRRVAVLDLQQAVRAYLAGQKVTVAA